MQPLLPEPGDTSTAAGVDSANLDWWFRALDNCWLKVGGQQWQAVVTGIHADGQNLWIQIGHAADPNAGIVLHLSCDAALDWRSAGLTWPNVECRRLW